MRALVFLKSSSDILFIIVNLYEPMLHLFFKDWLSHKGKLILIADLDYLPLKLIIDHHVVSDQVKMALLRSSTVIVFNLSSTFDAIAPTG